MDTVAGRAYDATNPSDHFTRGVHELVAATAPRLFAVVEEFRTEDGIPDAEVAAWGLAHPDGTAHLQATRSGTHLSTHSPDSAAALIARCRRTDAYVIWPDRPEPTNPVPAHPVRAGSVLPVAPSRRDAPP